MCNLCDSSGKHLLVSALWRAAVVWGALECAAEEQGCLIARVGPYLGGNRCGFQRSTGPRRYHSASAGGRPIHPKGQPVRAADSTGSSAAWPGSWSRPARGGFLGVMDGFSPAHALQGLLNHGHTAGKVTPVQ